MCRDFLDSPVDSATVERIIDRARRAPSAGHTQGWSFLVLDEPVTRDRFWSAAAERAWLSRPGLPGLLRAPVLVVPWSREQSYRDRYAEPDKAPDGPAGGWDVPYWTVDIAFATMLILLGVVEEGLGGLFFALRPGVPERLRTEFDVPTDWQPLGAIAIGWPAPGGGPRGSSSRKRLALEDVIHRGGW